MIRSMCFVGKLNLLEVAQDLYLASKGGAMFSAGTAHGGHVHEHVAAITSQP